MEEWKKVERFRRLEVSNMGNVKTVWPHKEKVLKPMEAKTTVGSYLKISVTLADTGKQEQIGVHILVAEAFVNKPVSELPLEPNHDDGDKHNNKASNLEWMTRSQNLKHAYATGLKSPSMINGRFGLDKSKPVKAVCVDTQKEIHSSSAKEMSELTGVPARTIQYNAFDRKHKKPVKGFVFSKVD